MAWIPVTEDDARLHPLYGFGGWLYVFYAAALFGLAQTFYSVLQVARVAGMELLFSPSMGFVWLHVALSLPFLLMSPMLARAMPIVAIICYWVGTLMGLRLFFLPGLQLDVMILARMAFWFAWGVVFTVYLLRSRRVNVTYLKRVAADEAAPVPAAV